MPASVTDKYQEDLIKLKDTDLPAQKIADYIQDKYGEIINPESISRWYKKQGISRSTKRVQSRACHGNK